MSNFKIYDFNGKILAKFGFKISDIFYIIIKIQGYIHILYLLKLKSGIYNKVLSTIFKVFNLSLHQTIACVRKSPIASHLGLQRISRVEVLEIG